MATANVGDSASTPQKTLSKYTRVRLLRRNGKKVRAHRWIMEQHIGRPLRPDEDVHHINHNPLDNRIENLQLMSRKDHVQLHRDIRQEYPDTRICPICSKEFEVPRKHRGRNKCCSSACAKQQSMNTRKANAASGVKPFKTASEETRRKMSLVRAGVKRKPHSEETKRKISEAAARKRSNK